MKKSNHSINYIEFPMTDLTATREFYQDVFGWTFAEWGTDYISFEGAGIDGGFDGSASRTPGQNGALVIVYSRNLETTREAIVKASGTITQEAYAFPGGRRFHFSDISGNELAVWSDRTEDGTMIEIS